MFFTLLVYIAALTLESLGSYISVVGLAAKTGPILVFLAITLDFAKIMIASVLYKQWRQVHTVLKIVLVPVLILLVTVTSTGTYAYIMKEFGKTTENSEHQKVYISQLKDEQSKLENRKREIDEQVSSVNANSVTAKRRLTDMFSGELKQINERLTQLGSVIPAEQQKLIQVNENTGTLGALAENYNVSPETVTKIVALLIAFMVDPLAIVLLTVANFLSEQQKKKKEEALRNPQLASVNPWDAFRQNLFRGKLSTKLGKKQIVLPYTDSSGFLIKNTQALSLQSFVKAVNVFHTPVKQMKTDKENVLLMSLLEEYSPQKSLFTKQIIKLDAKRHIQTVSEFFPDKPNTLIRTQTQTPRAISLLADFIKPLEITKEHVQLSPINMIHDVKNFEPEMLEKTHLVKLRVPSLIKNSEALEIEKHSIKLDCAFGFKDVCLEAQPVLSKIADIKLPTPELILPSVEIKTIEHLENQNIINEVNLLPSEQLLKLAEHELVCTNIIQPLELVKKTSYNLSSLGFLNEVIIEKDIDLSTQKNEPEKIIQEIDITPTIVSEQPLVKKASRGAFIPEALKRIRQIKEIENSFEESTDPSNFFIKEYPEDIMNYLDEEIAMWDEDYDFSDVSLRKIDLHIIPGFNLKKQLEEVF